MQTFLNECERRGGLNFGLTLSHFGPGAFKADSLKWDLNILKVRKFDFDILFFPKKNMTETDSTYSWRKLFSPKEW